MNRRRLSGSLMSLLALAGCASSGVERTGSGFLSLPGREFYGIGRNALVVSRGDSVQFALHVYREDVDKIDFNLYKSGDLVDSRNWLDILGEGKSNYFVNYSYDSEELGDDFRGEWVVDGEVVETRVVE